MAGVEWPRIFITTRSLTPPRRAARGRAEWRRLSIVAGGAPGSEELAVVTSTVPGESAPLKGEATFDAADRLAVINLLGFYAHNYDAGRLDEWQSVFTDDAEVRFFARDRVVTSTLAETRARHDVR